MIESQVFVVAAAKACSVRRPPTRMHLPDRLRLFLFLLSCGMVIATLPACSPFLSQSLVSQSSGFLESDSRDDLLCGVDCAHPRVLEKRKKRKETRDRSSVRVARQRCVAREESDRDKKYRAVMYNTEHESYPSRTRSRGYTLSFRR